MAREDGETGVLYTRGGADLEAASTWTRRARTTDTAALAAELARLLGDDGGLRFLGAAAVVSGAFLNAEACSIAMIRGEAALPLVTWASGDALARALIHTPWRYSRVPPALEAVTADVPQVVSDPRGLTLDVSANLPAVVREFPTAVFVPFRHGGRVVGLGLALCADAGWRLPEQAGDPAIAAAVGASLALAAAEEELGRVAPDDPLGRAPEGPLGDSVVGRLDDLARDLLRLTDGSACDAYRIEDGLLQPLFTLGDKAGYDPAYTSTFFALAEYPTSGAAVESGRPAFISLDEAGVVPHERDALQLWGYESQLSLPIVVHGRVRLLLEVYDTRPRDFAAVAEEAAVLCGDVADSLSGFLEIELLSRQGDALRGLVDLAAGASSASDAIELADKVARQLLAALEVQCVDICRVHGDAMRVLASADRSGLVRLDTAHDHTLGDYPLTAAALATGGPLIVSDPRDPRMTAVERIDFDDWGYQCEVCVPLTIGGEAIGFIDVFDSRPRQFGAFGELLGTVAQVVAGTLRRLELAAESAARAELLDEIVEIATLTARAEQVDVALCEAAERLRAALAADALDITRVEGDLLHPPRELDEDDDGVVPDSWSTRLSDYPRTADAVAGNAIVTLRPGDPELNDRERESLSAWGFATELIVPLRGRDRTIGFIDAFAAY